jgi:hypothetical protein
LLHALHGYDTSHVREIALYRSWLGEAYAKAGDVDQACAETTQVFDAVEGVDSARVDGRLLVLRRALRSYADLSVVREVEEPPSGGHEDRLTGGHQPSLFTTPTGQEMPVPPSPQ